MTWAKEAIAAFLMDDPSKDVDAKRASKRSEVALRKAFSIKPLQAGRKSLTTWSKRMENAEYDLVCSQNKTKQELTVVEFYSLFNC